MDLSAIRIVDIDMFMKEFKISDYSDPVQIAQLEALGGGARLGAGAMGSVFPIVGTRDVLKIYTLCVVGQRIPIMNELCALAQQGNVVYKIPYTPTNKMLVLAPNYITEVLIGRILADVSPSFVNLKRFYFKRDPVDPKVFAIMEGLVENDTKITSTNSILYMIVQIFQALSVGQAKNKFVHNDLHTGNIMARQYAGEKINCYEIGNGEYLYTAFDYDTCITDFGLSRCEFGNNILIPRSYVEQAAADSYLYNPYVDILSFINFLSYKTGVNPNPNFPMYAGLVGLADPDIRALMTVVLKYFFNGERALITDFLVRTWRADATKLGSYPGRLSNATEMFQKVAGTCIKFYLASLGLVQPPETQTAAVLTFLRANRFYISKTQLGLDNVTFIASVPIKESYDYRYKIAQAIPAGMHIDSIKDIIHVYYGQTLDQVDPARNVRRIQEAYNLMPFPVPINVQHVFAVAIDQAKGVEDGYKFKMDCCRIDVRDYFINTEYEAGAVINAGYFNIRTDFTPVGYLRTKNITFDNQLPRGYEPYYGVLVVKFDGTLDIVEYRNRLEYNQVLTCGAIVCFNTRPFFSTAPDATQVNIYEQDAGGVFKFLSTNLGGHPQSPRVVNGVAGIVKNVTNINPGELTHAGNPNPRTVIGIDRNGIVCFIRVEGRGRRGAGLDFIQLGELCQSLNLRIALNLDGGGSSRLCWKKPGENVINVSGRDTSSYPVGGVLAFVKE